jgi:hypothetical protein
MNTVTLNPKNITIKMIMLVKEGYSTQKGVDILKKFFTCANPNDIRIEGRNIKVDKIELFDDRDDEFYFFMFFGKTEKEIEKQIELYKIWKISIDDELHIAHKYELAYEKYKLLTTLLWECDSHKMDFLNDDGSETNIEMYSIIFSFADHF